MSQQHVTLVYPGDLNTRTGGYLYDKKIVEGLRSSSGNTGKWQVSLVSLNGDYPFPSDAHLTAANAAFAAIADNSLVVVDGLAYSVMPDVVAQHAKRLRLIALIHHPLALETGLSDTQSQALEQLETEALKHAHHIITTSVLTANSLSTYGVPASKVTAVLPGTDSAPLAMQQKTADFNLLCVATLTPRKAHNVLFDALATLTELPWHFYCVGSPDRDVPTAQALLAQRTALGLEERITFIGELDDTELESYYHQANLFVLSSYHEGYGMVLSEAIARGLPIVCSNAGAMPFTVPDGAGLLVPPGNAQELSAALKIFMTDATLREQLIKTAVKARDHLPDWQSAADSFATVLVNISKETSLA